VADGKRGTVNRTSSRTPDDTTEGRILGKYIAENFDGGKLGILAQNDDFAKEGIEGLKLGIEDEDADMEVVVHMV
jgi:hypothetical protein